MANEYQLASYPVYATKSALIKDVRDKAGPTCPNIAAVLIRIANTDFNALADKSTMPLATAGNFGLTPGDTSL